MFGEKAVKVVVKNVRIIPLTTLLFLLFLGLKLGGVITWSWWWVFAPLWMPWALVIGILVGIGLIALIIAVVLMFLDR